MQLSVGGCSDGSSGCGRCSSAVQTGDRAHETMELRRGRVGRDAVGGSSCSRRIHCLLLRLLVLGMRVNGCSDGCLMLQCSCCGCRRRVLMVAAGMQHRVGERQAVQDGRVGA